MFSIDRVAPALLLALSVSGCVDPEVGSDLLGSEPGLAVAHNAQVHIAGVEGDRALLDLSDDFRRSAPDMINFAFDSAFPDAVARSVLDRQAAWIVRHPQVRLRIYGHTDLVGSDEYNFRLGQRRAEAAAAYLVARGVEAHRLEAVASFGQTRPIIPTNNPERLNRRTVTEVVGYALPVSGGLDFDGKRAQAVYNNYVLGVRPQPAGAAAPGQIFATN